MILRPGDYLQNRYEILEMIGGGGMSEVYRAHCHKLNRDVAIKVLKREFCSDEEFVRKFKMEAQAAGSLNHPNIVNVYDVVDEEALHYIVMELVDGITLKEYIQKKGRLEVREALEIAGQVARGLGAAHRRGIVHRDVKSQNMILSKDGKVKVADFGIARAVSAQTMSSQAMGSVHYISPEQARGDYTDARSDIYSLGITIYEMVTGRLPFEGDTAVSVALAHIEEKMTPPSVYAPEIPAGLEQIILKCTKKDPEERYQDVNALISDMQEVYKDPKFIPDGTAETEPAWKPGDTRTIDRKEVARKSAEMRNRRKKPTAGPEPGETDRVDERLNQLLKIVGITLAIAFSLGLLFLFIQISGMFSGSGSQKSTGSGENLRSSAIDEQETYTPYLIGNTREDAEKELRKNGLQMELAKGELSEQFAEGLVMRQSPEAGAVVDKNSKVVVVLSLGSGETDLSSLKLQGMNAEDAAKLLKDEGFTVETGEAYSDTVAVNLVLSYSPEKAKPGEVVTLVISKGAEQKMATVPNLVGSGSEEASAAIKAAGLTEGTVSRVNSDTVKAGVVITQAQQAGLSVVAGSAVDYTISIGSENRETDYPVEPIEGDPNSRYVASINNTYELKNLIGPNSALTSVTVMIRLRQEVGGETVYQTLMEPRTVTADTIMPVRFKAIEGAYGVNTGYVEIVQVDSDTVLKSYEVQFFKVQ